MWIRNKNSVLIEIKRENYYTDTQYYNDIYFTKTGLQIRKQHQMKEKIHNILDVKNV